MISPAQRLSILRDVLHPLTTGSVPPPTVVNYACTYVKSKIGSLVDLPFPMYAVAEEIPLEVVVSNGSSTDDEDVLMSHASEFCLVVTQFISRYQCYAILLCNYCG